MGMYVRGLKPSADVGKEFLANVWWWHPLWDYCCYVAPELCSKVKYGHTNDGDGLKTRDSKTLSKLLSASIQSGEAHRYADKRDKELAAIPLERCGHCGGAGTRTWDGIAKECNACHGKKKVASHKTWYKFDADTAQQFAAFLEHCGGFEIN